jgi:tetratricopeptide (TPR) repeat protein
LLLQYDQRGHIDQALRALTLAVNQNPALTEAHAYLGLAYWRKYRLTKSLNDRGEAARAASDALALNPDSDVGWFVQGLVAGDKRNLTEAVASLSRANEKANWENGEALLQLASLWETMGQESNADYFAAKAQRVAAKPWYFYNAAASFEFSRGNPAAAISNLQLAVKTDPKSPYAWLNLGLVLVYQTNKSERDYASTCFQKSMELNPTPAAYDGLGQFYFSVGQWREAAKDFAEAERLNPARYDFPGKTGLALMRLPGTEDRQAAREKLLKAVDKAQTRLKEAPDALTAANLGLYQAALGQADEAVATFRRVAASSPGLGQLPDNLGTAAEYLELVYHSPAGASALRQVLSSLPTAQ